MPHLSSLRRVAVVSAAAVALIAGLSACGSSSSTTSSSSAAATTGSSAAGSTAQFQARLGLAKCLRAHGINVPDPTTGGGAAGGGGGIFRALQNYSQAQIQAARTACQQYLAQAFPRLNLTPAQRAQFQQEMVKFAQCMRSHGVNVPDPTTNGSGGFGIGRAFRSIDRNSPAFQSALKACNSLRPRFGRPGATGAPAGGGSSA